MCVCCVGGRVRVVMMSSESWADRAPGCGGGWYVVVSWTSDLCSISGGIGGQTAPSSSALVALQSAPPCS